MAAKKKSKGPSNVALIVAAGAFGYFIWQLWRGNSAPLPPTTIVAGSTAGNQSLLKLQIPVFNAPSSAEVALSPYYTPPTMHDMTSSDKIDIANPNYIDFSYQL